MKQMTLTLVFNKQCDKVLMCWHKKQNAWNFIGGNLREGESSLDASYRELFEETGIGRNDVTLMFVREEMVRCNHAIFNESWNMYITYAILDHDVELKPEKNELEWLSIYDTRIENLSFGYGDCKLFLNEALAIIKVVNKRKQT